MLLQAYSYKQSAVEAALDEVMAVAFRQWTQTCRARLPHDTRFQEEGLV
jgi:hypothetical protein